MVENTLKKDLASMFILSLACAILITATKAAVGERTELTDRTLKAVFHIIGEEYDIKTAYKIFDANFKIVRKGKTKFWQSLKDPALVACESMGGGMWGEITVVFVYNLDSNEILGLRVTGQKETAGLGDRITEEGFYSQFKNWNGGAIDGITGATTSSRAVEKVVKKSLQHLFLVFPK